MPLSSLILRGNELRLAIMYQLLEGGQKIQFEGANPLHQISITRRMADSYALLEKRL
jgi:hypothetical protein